MAKKELFWSFFVYLYFTFKSTDSTSVINFESIDGGKDSISVLQHNVFRRDISGNDAKCDSERQKLQSVLSEPGSIDDTHTFVNESKYAMALAWAGTNDGTLIIVTTKEDQTGTPTESTVYRSTNFGRNYTILSSVKDPIKKHNGLQRNPHDAKKVYLIGGDKVLYVTENGGETFTRYEMDFDISDEIIFHSSPGYDGYLLATDPLKNLYVSKDNGKSWTKTLNTVGKVYWGVVDETGSSQDTPDTIYATNADDFFMSAFSVTTYALMKTTDGRNWKKILDNVISYERQGNFLYASVAVQPSKKMMSDRLLKISTDCGKTWNVAQLPTIESDRFYSVMDIEDNMIFMHVDDPLDTGHGTLYTSSTQGVVYSESLPRHLYPNYGEIHDFYKVKSLRGVYITSQMNADDSIHTVISYNRGATWENIKRPDNTPCKDENKDCYLQIHGMYSIKRSINTAPPLSEETATGIVMAHGHVADALQRTPPDVFVSSDGGYNWRKTLDGPHNYQIGDHGGLLVAIDKSSKEPNTLKFSTDEGRCWHEYKFTDKALTFTGLLTEPEGKSLVVMIWGYLSESRKWEVHVIDFANVIKDQCQDTDYEPWLAHQPNTKNIPENVGCILGLKETYLRLKKDSFCHNGYEHSKMMTRQHCSCTREDYECDYGYFRPGGSDACVKIPDFKNPEIDICLRGHEEKLVSQGYRKIPGDQCSGGFSPSSKIINLNKVCDEASQILVEEDEHGEPPVARMSKGVKIFAVIIVIVVMALAAVMGVYFMRKYLLLRKHRVEYRYSMLNQNDDQTQDNRDWSDDLDHALTTSSINYQDSDEEELTTTTLQPSKSRRTQPSRPNGAVKTKDTNPFGSYHDDSDDEVKDKDETAHICAV